MIASGKATLSLICSVAGGVLNMALDYVFIVVLHWGIRGAAVATGLGYSYGVAPMLSYYYGEQNRAKLKQLVAVSLKVIASISILTVSVSFFLTRPLVCVFARPDLCMILQ